MSQHTPSPGLTLAIRNPARLMHGCKPLHHFTRQGGALGSQQCDWQLQDRAQQIHPLHCEIRWREEGFCIIDHSGATYLNGSDLSLPPATHVRLANHDQLQIGDYLIVACVGDTSGPASKQLRGEQLLSELLNGNQCPLQALVRPLPERPQVCIDAADLDPLIALDAAARQSRGTWLFGDLFATSKELE